MVFAESQTASDGASVGAHLRQGMKTLKLKVEDEPDQPDIPAELAYLWSIFCELNLSRSFALSEHPIQYMEIWAYTQLSGIVLEEWELAIIRELDVLYLKAGNDSSISRHRTTQPGDQVRPGHKRPG